MRRPPAAKKPADTPAPQPVAPQRKQVDDAAQPAPSAETDVPHNFAGVSVHPPNPAAPPVQQKKTTGIGDAPPEDAFDVATAPAAEEEHVLFPQNSATPAAGAVKKIAALLAKQTGPVTVEIDGYSSEEGDTDYNRNLSAHRAAAIKHALEGLLPAGSRVLLVAHGASKDWGEPEQNRRAGVHITAGITLSGAERPQFHVDFHLVPPLELGPKKEQKLYGIKPDLDILPKLPPSYFWKDPAPDPNAFTLPQLKTPQPDWGTLRAPFTGHGLRLTDRDFAALEQNWTMSYNFFLSLGFSPKDSADYAAKATGAAYDIQLSKENPTAIDRMNEESEKLGGPGKPTTIPILTPGVIEWVWPKIKRIF